MPSTLSYEERGFAAGLALLSAQNTAVDRALAGEGALAAVWARVTSLSHPQRATPPEEWLREACAPLPPGIDELDPSWAREALVEEPPGLALALAAELPALFPAGARTGEIAPWALAPAVRRALCWTVFVALEKLTVEAAGPLGRELSRRSGPGLELELSRWGARTVGASLAGAPLDLRARAMASAGSPWSAEIAGAAARPTDPASREKARRLVAKAAAMAASTPLHRLRTVGLLALAAALAAEGPASVRRVAGRLPAPLGRVLLAAG